MVTLNDLYDAWSSLFLMLIMYNITVIIFGILVALVVIYALHVCLN